MANLVAPMTDDEKKRFETLRTQMTEEQDQKEAFKNYCSKARQGFLKCTQRLFDELQEIADQVPGLRATRADEVYMNDRQLNERFRMLGTFAMESPRGKRFEIRPEDEFVMSMVPKGFGGLQLFVSGSGRAKDIVYDDKADRLIFPKNEPVVALDLVELLK